MFAQNTARLLQSLKEIAVPQVSYNMVDFWGHKSTEFSAGGGARGVDLFDSPEDHTK
jgi:hypothetical protein